MKLVCCRLCLLPPLFPSEPFKSAISAGDRGAIYPVLEFLLAKFSALQKRTYLSKFLMTVDIPQDILFDEGGCVAPPCVVGLCPLAHCPFAAVQEMSKKLKELQEEFKETHKTADKLVCDCMLVCRPWSASANLLRPGADTPAEKHDVVPCGFEARNRAIDRREKPVNGEGTRVAALHTRPVPRIPCLVADQRTTAQDCFP